MPYNMALAQRIQAILGERAVIVEKKMFGGVGYLLHGNMVCGVINDELITRVSQDIYDSAISQPFIRPFIAHTGKPMRGWVLVLPQGVEKDQDLQDWIERGYEIARALPEKK